jgi:hypothetical protein
MRPDVAAAFDRMANAARREAGLTLLITSGYRSDAGQAALFAAHPDPKWVAPPGTSLHRYGTELDLRATRRRSPTGSRGAAGDASAKPASRPEAIAPGRRAASGPLLRSPSAIRAASPDNDPEGDAHVGRGEQGPHPALYPGGR